METDTAVALKYELFEYELNPQEMKAYNTFCKAHRSSCGDPTAKFSVFRLIKWKNDGKVNVEVQCAVCNVKEDITSNSEKELTKNEKK